MIATLIIAIRFSTQPFAVQEYIQVQLNSETSHVLLSDAHGKYFLDMSDENLRIIKSNGDITENPIDFSGTPVSASYNDQLGWLAILDDLRSIAILKLNESGEVDASAVFGTKLDDDSLIIAGDINSNGELIVALDNETLATINLTDSIANDVWDFVAWDMLSYTPNWLAHDSMSNHLTLVAGDDNISLINTDNRSLIDTIELAVDESIIHREKGAIPHIIVNNESGERIIYINNDGELRSTSLPTLLDSAQLSLTRSLLNDDRSQLTVILDNSDKNDGARHFFKVRMSDNLVIQDMSFSKTEKMLLGENMAISIFDSALGLVEKINFDDETSESISGFNLKHLQGEDF